LPSFMLDLNAGKKQNEVLYHNGAIAQIAHEAGVPAPVNAALNAVLMGLASGEIARESFSGNPQALLNVVQQYRRRQISEMPPASSLP